VQGVPGAEPAVHHTVFLLSDSCRLGQFAYDSAAGFQNFQSTDLYLKCSFKIFVASGSAMHPAGRGTDRQTDRRTQWLHVARRVRPG